MQVPCILGTNLTSKDLLEFLEQVDLLSFFFEIMVLPPVSFETKTFFEYYDPVF